MSEARGQHEPSMEEILASIRRIIAEDGDSDAPPAPAPIVAEKPPSREEEVLELTEVVEDDGTVVSLAAGGTKKPEPAPRRAPSEPVVSAAPPRVEPVAEAPRRPPPPLPPVDSGAPLISETAAAASAAAIAQLSALASREQIGSVIMSDANRTLVDVVSELLRPLLKDWLDSNLPRVVERLVAEEIQRVSREQQRR